MSAVFPRPIKELLYDFEVSLSRELLALRSTLVELLSFNELLDFVVTLTTHVRIVLVLLSIPRKEATRQDVMGRGDSVCVASGTGKLLFTFHQTTPFVSPFPPSGTCHTVRVEWEQEPLRVSGSYQLQVAGSALWLLIPCRA